ncbi:hypothetical protein JCM14469_09300 [Desulfatiferula olefinivorans]
MTRSLDQTGDNHREYLEYHGNTSIVRVRITRRKTVERTWLLFDTVEEAMEYFHNAMA